MKKIIFLVVALCALGFLLVGCADRYTNPESRELVVFNDTTDQIIDWISINAYLSSSRTKSPNAMAEGETIRPGEKMSFYLPPYPDDTYIFVTSVPEDNSAYNDEYVNLNKENFVMDEGAIVEARYYYDASDDDEYGDGYLIEFGGDGYAPPVDL